MGRVNIGHYMPDKGDKKFSAEGHRTFLCVDFLCAVCSPRSIHCPSKGRGDLAVELPSGSFRAEGSTPAGCRLQSALLQGAGIAKSVNGFRRGEGCGGLCRSVSAAFS